MTNQKEAEEKQKALVESSPEAMLEINEKGTILLANSAATEIFGWTQEELIGANVNLIVGGDHAKEHSKYLARYLTTGEKRVMGKSRELPARKKDGTEFPIELGLTEVVLKDGHRVFCGEYFVLEDVRSSSLLLGFSFRLDLVLFSHLIVVSSYHTMVHFVFYMGRLHSRSY